MKSPSVSSMQSGAIRLRILFSAMHSLAAPGSDTAYLAPLWRSPWFLPEAPEAKSPFSIRREGIPLNAKSREIPTPVAPPPMINTSVSTFIEASFSGKTPQMPACR